MAGRPFESCTPSQIRTIQHFFFDTFPRAGDSLAVDSVDTLPRDPHKAYIITASLGGGGAAAPSFSPPPPPPPCLYMLKTPPPRHERLLRLERESASPAEEAGTLQLLATHALPLAVPVVDAWSASPDNALRAPFLLRRWAPGRRLAAVAHLLSAHDRAAVDARVGHFLRAVTAVRGERFGPAPRVAAGRGLATWREAFVALLEGALRDAEDLRLTLPYASIRPWVYAHAACLDAVVEARLCPMRAGTEQTVIVDEDEGKTVVCVVGWGSVVWGDPALGEAFADDVASEGMWYGFGGRECLSWGDGMDERRAQMRVSLCRLLRC
jgi:hypothetical protein